MEILPKVIHGDVLILGNAGLGKTTLAQALEKQGVSAGRRVCVLDEIGSWSAGQSTRRILRLREGKVVESGYSHSRTTVWNFEGRAIPPGVIDLADFDDVILDGWKGPRSPSLEVARHRWIVVAQILDDALEAHEWAFVIVFNLRFGREITFARGWGGHALVNLGWGRAQLLSQSALPQTLQVL